MRGVDRARPRLPIALAAAVGVAQAAVLILRPRRGVIDPDPVSARSYFSEAELERARAFRRPQLALALGAMAVESGLLALLAARPPAALRSPGAGPASAGAGPALAGASPALAGAVTGGGLSVALTAATLPLGAVAHRRAVAVGLSTQGRGSWLRDRALAGAIGTATAAVGGAGLLALARRFPRHWWAPGSAAAVGVGAAVLFAGPVVLDPLFNRFTALEPGETRDDVLALARDAGVEVGEVYEVDASRRTTGANAYVTGLGATKRVVLFDTLLRDFSREELALVVAHELSHVRHRDVPRGLLYLALVAPAALLAAQRLAERLAPGRDGSPAMIPAAALALGAVSFATTAIANQLSRRIEARADGDALRLTGSPEPFIAMERRLALQNLADPDPPAWLTRLMATHPPTVDRIGIGLAFARGGEELSPGQGPGQSRGQGPGQDPARHRTPGGS
jgi:STE24 endopeptidase